MARIRSVHPEQWTDDQFVTCSPLARLVAIGVRNYADDNGIFEWNPIKLKMRILPADNCDMGELLAELVSTGQILRYEVDGKSYGIIRSFQRFQSPKKPSFTYPVPTDLPRGYALNKAYFSTGTEPVENQDDTGEENLGQRRGEEGSGEEEKKGGKPPGCPHDEIIALYHELLPTCPHVKEWHTARQAHLKARWREDPRRQNLDWWRKYFSYVAKSDFLTGRAKPREGSAPFFASLEWLVKQGNFAKVVEGQYHREAA